jgi:RimJ/RimL family protein N-acetyltransferase
MAAVPTLADDTLLLGAFTFEDVAPQLAGEDEEHARRFGWYPQRSTEETVRKAISGWQEDWEHDGLTRAFAARETESGKLVGGCQLRLRGDEVAQLSYWSFPSHRRSGYASRAVSLVCRFAFSSLGIERIEALVEPDNAASIGVLQRNGFVEEGRLRNRWRLGTERRDMLLFSLLPSDL